MNYEHVIPNLECAKLYTYFHNKHEVANLASTLAPEKYTKFYIRKEYDDGSYPRIIFSPNCEYGGRAFNPNHYSPLAPEIERTIPNMKLYQKYRDNFGSNLSDHRLIKRILNCAHIRLSTDEINGKSQRQLQRIMDTGRYTGIIFHDYNLASIKDSYDIIYTLSQTRYFKERDEVNPYAIGNKFPIQVTSSDELEKWLKVTCIPGLFSLQFNGVMTDQILHDLCAENRRMARQVYYQIDADCSTENDLLMDVIPKIYMQATFLKMEKVKILLKYDKSKIVTKELRNLIELLNCWISFKWQEDFGSKSQSLYGFCRDNSYRHYTNWAFLNVTVSTEDARDVFQYVREHNYDLFRKFYEMETVELQGGKFIDVRTGN